MGKKPADIENEIRARRAAITRRIEDLQQRAQTDVETVRDEAASRASTAIGDTKEALRLDALDDTLRELVESHTLSSVAGALGLGVLLGAGVPRMSQNGDRPGGGADSQSPSRNEGGSKMSGILGSILEPAASTARDELQGLVREGFSAFKQQFDQSRERGTVEEDPAGERPAYEYR